MNFERFIATFVMMNIVLMLAIVFAGKDEIFTETASQVLFGKKASPEFFTLKPSELENFQEADRDLFNKTMNDIFTETHISKTDLDKISSLPPYEQSAEIVKLYSLMGDGECLEGLSASEKINKMRNKEGCSKDFAQIFGLLASYNGLDVRMVSNGFHFANEIFDGKQWVYIDPYLAMSVSAKDGRMSYIQFADAMVNDGWMSFRYFGGEDHCMNGKPVAEHPYFGDKFSFASVYMYNGDNFAQMLQTQQDLADRALFIKKYKPYKQNAPALVYSEVTDSRDGILRKYVTAGLLVAGAVFAGTNIVLPLWFLAGLFKRFKDK